MLPGIGTAVNVVTVLVGTAVRGFTVIAFAASFGWVGASVPKQIKVADLLRRCWSHRC